MLRLTWNWTWSLTITWYKCRNISHLNRFDKFLLFISPSIFHFSYLFIILVAHESCRDTVTKVSTNKMITTTFLADRIFSRKSDFTITTFKLFSLCLFCFFSSDSIIFRLSKYLRIITPSDPKQRGCQLSLMFNCDLHQVHKNIEQSGVVCDVRWFVRFK